MKPSRRSRVRRPYARPSRRRQERLAREAGLAPLAGTHSVEMLEPRQLLFTLTLDPGDPTGSGATYTTLDDGRIQAVVEFAYVLPALAPTAEFEVDPMAMPAGTEFVGALTDRVVAVRVTFTGNFSSATTVTFTDLNGNPLVATLDLLEETDDSDLLQVDSSGGAGDGIPDFNNGIGLIVLSNTDEATDLEIIGGTLDFVSDAAGVREYFFQALMDFDEVAGNATSFFGHYAIEDQVEDTVDVYNSPLGVPETNWSLVIGSPFGTPGAVNTIAPNVVNVGGGGEGFVFADDFTNANQGIRITDGSNVGDIVIHGLLYGSSEFSGSVGLLNVSALYGDLTVDADLGGLIIATEAGVYSIDEAVFPPELPLQEQIDDGVFSTTTAPGSTGSAIFVGRTAGEIASAGRFLSEVTVQGDTSGTPPASNVLTYEELERFIGVNPALNQEVMDVLGQGGLVYFGTGAYRNDSLMGAEFIGSNTGTVEINGNVGASNAVYETTDVSDVYGFVVDGTGPVTIQVFDRFLLNVRVMNEFGQTIAALNADSLTLDDGSAELVFEPLGPGIYYLVIGSNPAEVTPLDDGDADDEFRGIDYRVFITGLAPVALGAFRTGAGIGETDAPGVQSVTVLAGGAGAIRAGVGFLPSESNADDDQSFDIVPDDAGTNQRPANLERASFTITGNLYSVTVGENLFNTTISVSGDFGTLLTDADTTSDPTEESTQNIGDVSNLTLLVGGNISVIDVRGSVEFQTEGPTPGFLNGLTTITAGLNAGSDGATIGMIRVAGNVIVGGLAITTPDNSVIDAILIAADIPLGTDGGDGIVGFGGDDEPIIFDTGSGSDIRFLQAGQVNILGSIDETIAIDQGGVTLVDDNGSVFTVSFTPGDVETSSFIRFVPVDGSEGGVVAEIVVDMSSGGTLVINGLDANGSVGIGRILVLNADVDEAESIISIGGLGEIDILEIVQLDGDGLTTISNTTQGGDIVAIDVQSVEFVTITGGNLGATQVTEWGPSTLAPNLGVAAGLNDATGGALGVDPAALRVNFNGQIYRGLADNIFGDNAYADEIGFPIDPYLNGLVARSGNVGSVRVAGSVGDVILQADGAFLFEVIADFDNSNAAGEFHGIVGNIYASRIGVITVGDGLASNPDSAVFATVGIFANDDIDTVQATQAGANIEGLIIAAGLDGDSAVVMADGTESTFGGVSLTLGDNDGDGVIDFNGINTIRITSDGSFVGATIIGNVLSSFWAPVTPILAFVASPVNIGQIIAAQGDFIASEVSGNDLGLMQLGGYFDGSFINLRGTLQTFTAEGIRNSFLGERNNQITNRIEVSSDIGRISTNNNAGDISDITIEVLGNVTESISAFNFSRMTLNVDNEIQELRAFGDFLSSAVIAGALPRVFIADDIVSSVFTISGVVGIDAGDSISNTTIEVTGPDGLISLVRATNHIDASITATGPITLIDAVNGNISGFIGTTTERGSIGTISAGGGFFADTDIARAVTNFTVGGDIGRTDDPNVILINGDLTNFSAGGRLLGELRVGENILGGLTIGEDNPTGSSAGAGRIEAAGSIVDVEIFGSFGGEIIANTDGVFRVTINGSLLATGSIRAFDGDIGTVLIDGGNLLGDIIADGIIFSVTVAARDDGFGGNIGADDSVATTINDEIITDPSDYDNDNNTARVLIQAGQNIGLISVEGSAYEVSIIAGAAIDVIEIGTGEAGGSLTGNAPVGVLPTVAQGLDYVSNLIAAGDQINMVSVMNGMDHTLILAGFTGVGADGLVGGSDDEGRSGKIETIEAATLNQVAVSAGVGPGADGIYNSTGLSVDLDGDSIPDTDTDDVIRMGVSYINEIIGDATAVSAFSDAFGGALGEAGTLEDRGRAAGAGDITIRGSNGHLNATPSGENADLPMLIEGFDGFANTIGAGNTIAGGAATSGPGTFTDGVITITTTGDGGLYFYDTVNNVFYFAMTDFNNSITITSSAGTITNLVVVGIDDASIGEIAVEVELAGSSAIYVDGFVQDITTQNFSGTGGIFVGGNILRLTTGSYDADFLRAQDIGTLTINGTLGSTTPGINAGSRDDNGDGDTTDAEDLIAGIDILAATIIRITGDARARINIERSVSTLTIDGAADNALIRIGQDASRIDIGSGFETRISVNGRVDTFNVDGDFEDSALLLGLDLGADADFDSVSGLSNDRLTIGSLGTATIGGDFIESDIVAGVDRGIDGFFGTADDGIARGRGNITTFTVQGEARGTAFNSESFLVSATGDVVSATINGQSLSGDTAIGNLTVESLSVGADAILVESVVVEQSSRIFTAVITFNQAMDAASLLSTTDNPLTITSLTNPGGAPLVLDTDYTLSYDEDNFALRIRFEQDITDRAVAAATAADPGPGVFRFELSQEFTQAAIARARLDGNGDGSVGVADNFTVDAIVGDAGDRPNEQQGTLLDANGNPIDLYGATVIDEILDVDNDSVIDFNTTFTVTGTIGDNSQNSAGDFPFGADIDIYQVSLSEGQILNLSGLSGPASNAAILVFGADELEEGLSLLSTSTDGISSYLVETSGVYTIVIANSADFITDFSMTPPETTLSFLDTLNIADPASAAGTLGEYSFTINILEDQNSGFDSGVLVDAITADTFFDSPAPTAQQIVDNGGSLTVNGTVFTLTAQAAAVLTSTEFDGSNADDYLALQLSSDVVILEGAVDLDMNAGTNEFVRRLADGSEIIVIAGFSFSLADEARAALINAGFDPTTEDADTVLASLLAADTVIVSGTDESGEITSRRLASGQEESLVLTTLGSSPEAGVTSGEQADLDVYDINGGEVLIEGTLVRITINLSDFGSDLGSTDTDFVKFAVFDTTIVGGELLLLSPGVFGPVADTSVGVLANDGQTSYGYDASGDFFIEFVTPQDGVYSVYLQGLLSATYGLEVLTAAEGAETFTEKSQNILIEFDGGTIDWLLTGEDLEVSGFDASASGLVGLVPDGRTYTQFIVDLLTGPGTGQGLIQAIFDNAVGLSGLNVTVSTNPADFEFQEFSTVFVTSSTDPLNSSIPGPGNPFGYNEGSDPLNARQDDEAVVFVPTFNAIGAVPIPASTPSTTDLIDYAEVLSNSIARQIGELLGIRVATGTGVESSINPLVGATEFALLPFGNTDEALDGFFIGNQNADSLLDLILE
ncbi:MAG: hypothetical protein AAGB51_02720 [Planctomycetota bacterium]